MENLENQVFELAETLFKEVLPTVSFTTQKKEHDWDDFNIIQFKIPYHFFTEELWDNFNVLTMRFSEELSKITSDFWTLKFIDEPPDLVSAEVGDFVEIYRRPYYISEKDFGVVTSKIHNKDSIVYGCRYFLVDPFGSSIVDKKLELSAPNYGGYHSGFIRKLDTTEIVAVLSEKVDVLYQKGLRQLEENVKRGKEDISNIVSYISKGTVAPVEILLCDPSSGPFFVSLPEEMTASHYEDHKKNG